MTYCTYITVHQPSGRFYIGKGVTDAVRAGKYKGSGTILKKTFKKYPPVLWDCAVLWEFETEEEAYSDEAGIVTEELLQDPLCLNCVTGGQGHPGVPAWNRGLSTPEEVRAKMRGPKSPEHIAKAAATKKSRPTTPKALGQLRRMSETNKGLHWFNDGATETKFRTCPDGWKLGRIYKPRKKRVL